MLPVTWLVVRLYVCFAHDRFFVPPTEKQLQMTGRLWRHGLTMMPHMIAGVGGPSEQQHARHTDAAPAQARETRRAPPCDEDEVDDGHGLDGVSLEEADEVLPDPDVPDIVHSSTYQRLYGDLPLHRAVLDVYCRMAVLGGRLMGDNMANTTHMSEQQMRALAQEAREFIVDHVDLLFGPAHTTKAHRLANHLLSALLGNGNLWEGDTSENEALHGPCKKMYARTNKRGPTMVVQMMRAAETQAEVLREIREFDLEDAGGSDGIHLLLESDAIVGDVATAPAPALSRSHRGLRITIADAEELPGMASLGTVLGKQPDCTLVVSPSFTFHCTFEWGASSVVQTACATETHFGKPRYDYIWYTDEGGRRQLGLVRLVVRMLGGAVDDFAVVRCLREVPSIPRCSLTRSGCRRMAWCFENPSDDWPLLACVPLTCVLRLEHVVPDFQDLAERRGLRAMPSNVADTASERHATRFFTNHFYPFTSRALNPGS